MSIIGTGVPTNRTNIQLPNEVSAEILQKTQEGSMVMQLARQIALPGRGAQIPIIASDPEAAWVSETGMKAVSNPTLDKKIMQAHKLAVIVPFSDEFRRDAAALYDALIARLPGVLAKKFDNTVFFGPASGTLANFDNFSAVTGYALDALNKTAYDGLVAADVAVSTAGGTVNGFAFSPQGRGVLLSATDGDGRPLFVPSVADGAVNRILALLCISVLPLIRPDLPRWVLTQAFLTLSVSPVTGRTLCTASLKALRSTIPQMQH